MGYLSDGDTVSITVNSSDAEWRAREEVQVQAQLEERYGESIVIQLGGSRPAALTCPGVRHRGSRDPGDTADACSDRRGGRPRLRRPIVRPSTVTPTTRTRTMAPMPTASLITRIRTMAPMPTASPTMRIPITVPITTASPTMRIGGTTAMMTGAMTTTMMETGTTMTIAMMTTTAMIER